MFVARTCSHHRATACVVYDVIGLAVAIVVFRRAAITRATQYGAHAFAPYAVGTNPRSEAANPFLYWRATRLGGAVDAGVTSCGRTVGCGACGPKRWVELFAVSAAKH